MRLKPWQGSSRHIASHLCLIVVSCTFCDTGLSSKCEPMTTPASWLISSDLQHCRQEGVDGAEGHIAGDACYRRVIIGASVPLMMTMMLATGSYSDRNSHGHSHGLACCRGPFPQTYAFPVEIEKELCKSENHCLLEAMEIRKRCSGRSCV